MGKKLITKVAFVNMVVWILIYLLIFFGIVGTIYGAILLFASNGYYPNKAIIDRSGNRQLAIKGHTWFDLGLVFLILLVGPVYGFNYLYSKKSLNRIEINNDAIKNLIELGKKSYKFGYPFVVWLYLKNKIQHSSSQKIIQI
ncbi:hypothetical protein [[Mycoplasma] testudinis]|uniref:hypothetical protein n=1 Tax=[Mycoplasma] testudinis TaxID=33924 RepID=UPI000483E5E7|nr:hypothetical protein [[Mycoplasma] testudinis]